MSLSEMPVYLTSPLETRTEHHFDCHQDCPSSSVCRRSLIASSDWALAALGLSGIGRRP